VRIYLGAWPLGVGAFGAVVLLGVGMVGGCSPKNAVRPAAAPAGVASGLPRHRLVSAAGREQFTGSAACVKCHAKQGGQIHSRHARTLSPVTLAQHGPAFSKGAKLSDPLDDLTFTTLVKDGRCVLQAREGEKVHEAVADYAFGSGAIGSTYVSYQDGKAVQLRLSHYVRGNHWEFTPGLQMGGLSNSSLGQVLAPEDEKACFLCHTTALVETGGHLDLQQSLLGVGCETCHGPGKAHIEAVRRGDKDRLMAKLSAAMPKLSMELCGQCHRAPNRVDLTMPGMQAQLPRMQSLALSMSACFKKGGITCVSCHNPHRDAADVSTAEYNARCLSCHQPVTAAQVACPVQPHGDCVSCHMPAQEVGIPSGPRFRNHWIKAWSARVSQEKMPIIR
jgi:hypothetical protein